ncbi:MAG: hypothetical protein PHT12_06515, partial [Patescibacteria group bacterium]|nr:hypothetical protein [Patescibacteria group bacterium]
MGSERERGFNPEMREEKTVRVSPLTAAELYGHVYKRDDQGEQYLDARFEDAQRGGRFTYFDRGKLASYVHGSKEGLVYIAAFDGDQIIGLQELQKDPNQENVYWMT